jgi:ABC-type transport system involved in cytochrome c biogenesis permease subunit
MNNKKLFSEFVYFIGVSLGLFFSLVTYFVSNSQAMFISIVIGCIVSFLILAFWRLKSNKEVSNNGRIR